MFTLPPPNTSTIVSMTPRSKYGELTQKYGEFRKRLARKLRRIMLLHFGLVTFRFHFGETRKPIISMVFGPSGRDHDAQNQLLSTLDTPNDSN